MLIFEDIRDLDVEQLKPATGVLTSEEQRMYDLFLSGQMQGITDLDIRGDFGNFGARVIAKCIAMDLLDSLNELSLLFTGIPCGGFDMLTAAYGQIKKGILVHLRLSFAGFPDDNGVALGRFAAAIVAKNQLQYIDLSCNGIGNAVVKMLVQALGAMYCSLGVLSLGSWDVDKGAGSLVARIMDKCPNLSKLFLYNSDWSPNELRPITQHSTCKLRTLDISGTRGGDAIPAMISIGQSKLVRLKLSSSKMSNVGMCALFNALLDPWCCLKKLDIDGNDIGYDGLKCLVDVFKTGRVLLTHLNLGYVQPGCRYVIGDSNDWMLRCPNKLCWFRVNPDLGTCDTLKKNIRRNLMYAMLAPRHLCSVASPLYKLPGDLIRIVDPFLY